MLIIETLAVLQKPGFLSADEESKVMHHISNVTCCLCKPFACPGFHVVGTALKSDKTSPSSHILLACCAHMSLLSPAGCVHPPASAHFRQRRCCKMYVITGTLCTHVLRSSWWEPRICSACCRPRL